jgi:hypothetical protein
MPLLAFAVAALFPLGPVEAHTTERAFVLLLPTAQYLAGGTAAVAASVLVLFLIRPQALRRLSGLRLRLGQIPIFNSTPTSMLSALLFVALVLAGWWGSRNPLANPLPLSFWTLGWIGLTFVHAILGNVWAYLNPWLGPYRLLWRRPALRAYPAWLGYWPSVLIFLVFAWFELVYPAPDDPARLAAVLVAYWLVTFAGMILFGGEDWLRRAEPFSVFFGLVARLSPLDIAPAPGCRSGVLRLILPGAALLKSEPLPLSGTIFVLATLSTVSFDGLSRTFFWLAKIGVNPLEFPGRTEVMGPNSGGLFGAAFVLIALYFLSLSLSLSLGLGGRMGPRSVGHLALSIIPISLAYHFAHYLTVVLVNTQYALLAFNDPLGRGWDLFGIGTYHVTTSFLTNFGSVKTIWSIQVAAIVCGHLLAVFLAHLLWLSGPDQGDHARQRPALLAQLPLAFLMILYTLFGLWLLAAPTAG